MPDPGVVVRLLAAIDERETKAREAGAKAWHVAHGGQVNDAGEIVDCEPDCDCCRIEGDDIVIYDEGGHDACQAEHIAANDPHAVLRLCRSHRDIVAQYEVAAKLPGELMARRTHGVDVMIAEGAAKALLIAVLSVARGYGIEDGED